MLYLEAARQDRPIESEREDRLDRIPFVENLARALVIEELDDNNKVIGRRSTGYVVGLTGQWGLGKSSVLNLLARHLEATEHVVVATFNPWLFSGRDELVSGFFNALRGGLGRSLGEKAGDLMQQVDRYWGAIDLAGKGAAAMIDLVGGAGAATAVWKSQALGLRDAVVMPKVLTPDEERVVLERKIAEADCAVVVLIDELDRVEDEEVRAVARLVKAIGDIKGVSYLVAYDPVRVVQALGRGEGDERRRSGESYLEKIIQHPIPLRPLFSEDAHALLNSAISGYGIPLEPPRSESQRALFNHIINAIKTPREVKRLVGAFTVLERAVSGEICPYDVLGYCWIISKSPGLRDKIADHLDALVNDPPEVEMSKRAARSMNNESDLGVVDILGSAAEPHEKTLKLLFPRFGEGSAEDNGDKLSRRRNLVRMLYLGNPPGAIRRADIEALWNIGDVTELERALRTLMEEGKLAAAIDRIDDLLHLLPERGEKVFWPAMSSALRRKTDWASGPAMSGSIADDAAAVLYRSATRDTQKRKRLKSLIHSLIRKQDLLLVPWILRKNLFAHGLTYHSKTGRGGEILTLEETKDLLAREVPRYQQAVISGVALKRVPTLEAVYVLANTEHWTPEIRSAFTDQLDSLEAIATFAALKVPPGYGVDPTSLNKLIDTDAVFTTLEKLGEPREPADPWLAECLQRLRNVLRGETVF
ncbi:KAP family NTPase [Afifella marina]|uniref:KAP family P-loop domain-containing protein n=1 Tax=Afifella marina DSM 2698 TaxID=1120955 RepID=A0A1G5NZ92_AFIMA|nr:KAP family NTPase [Afifella marina]MBK1624936.1 hypothetical protein [Afifella marina DSM 2698]MBK1628639.1 hypothetical protein [Afifella marina]MBK5916469.1 hypothetical protein [Afifella marina]RAI17708.1 hypothetical protein CH311_17615 [Afifella marina DSM 2698]SCZ42268.1 KAP family P-loop domain-containing protein [Afifella marina DSM 2698]